VRGAGDLDGDGFDDVVVGAYLADTGGRFAAGESYVVFGRATTTTSDAAAVAHADLAPPGRSR
jgi:hypothetical protein